MSGLLKAKRGKIFSDGVDITDNLTSWRLNVGYVSQNTFILDDSLEKNITFGESEVDKEKLEKAIEMSGLSKFVRQIPDGVKINLGEDGNNISGGQIQRVGIARALYRRPKILILDEATNALDEKTENEIIENIIHLRGKMTIIFISHKTKLLENFDKVLKIQNQKMID